MPELILASRSPQRRAILEQLGVGFTVVVADVDELDSGVPQEVCVQNALLKAAAVPRAPGDVVLACDTIVTLDGDIFGKAPDREGAEDTLLTLSGRTHTVLSGVAVIDDEGERTKLAASLVSVVDIDDTLLEWYLDSEEWRERAGCYAIQGRGAALVGAIDGEYTNVVGLPVSVVLELVAGILQRFSQH